MKKLAEILIYVLIGAVVIWSGGEWYHMFIAQGLAAASNIVGFAEGFDRNQ